jgi:hypothetical protein
LKKFRIKSDREFFNVSIDIIKEKFDEINIIFNSDNIYEYIVENNYTYKCDTNIINGFIEAIKSISQEHHKNPKTIINKEITSFNANVVMEKVKKEFKEMMENDTHANFKFNAEVVALWLCIGYNKLCETLKKSYIKDIDYKVIKRDPTIKRLGGQNKLTYFLTNDCFKKVLINTGSKNKSKILQILNFDHLL